MGSIVMYTSYINFIEDVKIFAHGGKNLGISFAAKNGLDRVTPTFALPGAK
jgi:hypothetical protein